MPNKAKATILNLSTSLGMVSDSSLGFSKPYFNGIFIVDTETLGILLKFPLYGDEMTWQMWGFLYLPVGTITDNDPILTRVDNYKYKYNLSTHTFSAYDDKGVRFVYRQDIKSIADMHIDFTIHKSHQFMVVSNIGDFTNNAFFIPAKLVKRNYYNSILQMPLGVVGDNYSNYLYKDYSNAQAFSFRGVHFKKNKIETYSVQRDDRVKPINITSTGVNITGFDFNKTSQISQVYDNPIKNIPVDLVKRLYKARIPKLNGVFSLLSISLLSQFQPIQRPGETNNIRPVYEPWLIWGFFKLVWLHRIKSDDDDLSIDIWDLSPNWSK